MFHFPFSGLRASIIALLAFISPLPFPDLQSNGYAFIDTYLSYEPWALFCLGHPPWQRLLYVQHTLKRFVPLENTNPGILNFIPLVDVPAAVYPFLWITTMPRSKRKKICIQTDRYLKFPWNITRQFNRLYLLMSEYLCPPNSCFSSNLHDMQREVGLWVMTRLWGQSLH